MLSIIFVNYNSSALLKNCYSSIISIMGNDPFEFFVIDSGSREEEVNSLLDLKGNNINIILNRENIGYAKAINTGIRNARGDFILITNPDMFYMTDSIKIMLHALQEIPHCGAVAPRTWWDEKMTFLLPFSEIITPYWMLQQECMRVSQTMRDMILNGWIKRAVRYWSSEKTLEQEMLSGACIMTTKKVLERVGGFDEMFPLYFEDTDWCLRMKKAGYRLYVVPDAKAIHYYNQSAKQEKNASKEKYDYSLDIYLKKHFKDQFYFITMAQELLESSPYRADNSYDDLGLLTEPPVFTFKNGSKKILLLSPLSSLIPSAGSLFEGNSFQISKGLWDSFGEGRFFVKAFDLNQLKECGSWSWMKRSSD